MRRGFKSVGFLVAVILSSGCKISNGPSVSPSPLNQEQLGVYRGFLDAFSALILRISRTSRSV